MKKDLTQLNKVEQYLINNGIPYERKDKEDKLVSIERDGEHYVVYEQTEFHQICVPSKERREWDVICHRGSYGAEKGLLEIMGAIVRPCGNSVEGWLTADDVIARIEEKKKVREYIIKETGYPGTIKKEIVQELVRCKDCRWWERDYQPRYHPDERPCNRVGMGTPPEWYCADNERRDDDTD